VDTEDVSKNSVWSTTLVVCLADATPSDGLGHAFRCSNPLDQIAQRCNGSSHILVLTSPDTLLMARTRLSQFSGALVVNRNSSYDGSCDQTTGDTGDKGVSQTLK